MPAPVQAIDDRLIARALKLNCLTRHHALLWEQVVIGLGDVDVALEATWESGVAYRSDAERWQALVEIDALVAILIGMDWSELSQIYRSHFPVLRSYEVQMYFDRVGDQVCGDAHARGRKQMDWEDGQESQEKRQPRLLWPQLLAYLKGDDEVDLGPLEPPFRLADREAATRLAFQRFASQMAST